MGHAIKVHTHIERSAFSSNSMTDLSRPQRRQRRPPKNCSGSWKRSCIALARTQRVSSKKRRIGYRFRQSSVSVVVRLCNFLAGGGTSLLMLLGSGSQSNDPFSESQRWPSSCCCAWSDSHLGSDVPCMILF